MGSVHRRRDENIKGVWSARMLRPASVQGPVDGKLHTGNQAAHRSC